MRELSLILREETQAAHRQVESAGMLKDVFSPEFCLTSYSRLLLAWQGFFKVLDDALGDFAFLEYVYCPRSAAIRSDLSQLILDQPAPGPVIYTGWCPASFEEKLGCVYVIEGSSLGARIITRRLQECFGSSVRDALSFYSFQPCKWPVFRAWLDQLGASGRYEALEVVAAANSIFHGLYIHMNANVCCLQMDSSAETA